MEQCVTGTMHQVSHFQYGVSVFVEPVFPTSFFFSTSQVQTRRSTLYPVLSPWQIHQYNHALHFHVRAVL
jgi:hypothetical protein